MSGDKDVDARTFRVVVTHDERYSIWPADRDIPLGWHDVGKSGSKQECLDYIEVAWLDMRPPGLPKDM